MLQILESLVVLKSILFPYLPSLNLPRGLLNPWMYLSQYVSRLLDCAKCFNLSSFLCLYKLSSLSKTSTCPVPMRPS